MGLKNTFGWSLSRESLFDSCRKRYYFYYYLSWEGWKAGAPEITREAFLLKRLVSLALWRGQLVHYITSKVLQSTRRKGRIPAEEKVLEYAGERFDRQYQFSARRRYLDTPKKTGGKLNIDWLALFDHEYGLRIPARKLENAREEVKEGLKNLIHSDILRRASLSDSSQWIIEDIDMSEFAQSFYFRGVKIFVKTDFIFRCREGLLNIVDWKTFSGSGNNKYGGKDQLGLYGYYAVRQMNEPPENVALTEVNLLDSASEKSFRLGGKDISRAEERIEKGIEKLSSVIQGGDIEKNRPLPPGNFPPDPGVQCRFCNFRRICSDAAYPA
ncbi:MAG: PD-(D/E)XK nuclease family protein [Candidatus Krumholzibacteriota bacterium]